MHTNKEPIIIVNYSYKINDYSSFNNFFQKFMSLLVQAEGAFGFKA